MPTIDISRYPKKLKKVASNKEGFDVLALLNRDFTLGSKELKDKKKEYFYLELGSLLKAGINLKSCLELIRDSQEDEKDKKLFTDIHETIIKGTTFSNALKHSQKFSFYEVFSIQIGEESGKLTEVFEDLAKYYQDKIKQRRKVVSALTYPCVVLSFSAATIFFMLKFMVPMFGDVFKRFGGHLPWITEKIINVSSALQNGFFPFVIIVTAVSVTLWNLRKKEQFRKISTFLILRTPVVGALVQKIYLARFCNSMRLLISAHLPLLSAINLSKQMMDYYPIESTLQKVEDDIMKGNSLHHSLEQFPIYPKKMVQLLKVGEEGNKLDYFFNIIAERYVEEIGYQTTALSSIMEPVFTIVLGLVVGIIMIAMYLPLFQMSSNF